LFFGAGAARAFDRSDGVRVQCEIVFKGQLQEVREVWLGSGEAGQRYPELGGAAAVMRLDADGMPVIFFDTVVFKGMLTRDPHLADFIFYHECGHAKEQNLGEIEANCYAVLEMQRLGLMSDATLAALGATHGQMLRLPSRYGGSGQVFWGRTMTCVRTKTEAAAAQRYPDHAVET